jgi:glycine/D-amino acid oxidase-like deaminating enzyme
VERGEPLKGTRREFLSAALIGLNAKADPLIGGSFVNESAPIGHRIRDHAAFPAPSERVKIPLVIVGGGIAGLSAAWRLDKRGFHDFVLLELENEAGGNARSGANEITAYPWAAHYVPVPNRSATLARELFEELGVSKNGVWDERTLCFSPQERLFLFGRWQEGLEPGFGVPARDRHQFEEFEKHMAEFRHSGEFTIPVELGAKPSPLDGFSMAEWMRRQNFDSSFLRWYVNYACRDDYGATSGDTSAWAGIHYFTCREYEDKGPLVWPGGNGWITKRLLEKLGRYVHTGSMVHRIEKDGTRFRVLAARTEYIADAVIFAAPTFLAPYIVEGAAKMSTFEYSPWLVANLTIEHPPRQGVRDFETAWDNVIYDSPALGYVVATHQSLATHIDRSVWTFYWAFAEGQPAQNRKFLLAKDWGYWKEAILNDLGRAHPDIRSCVSRIDIMRLGHAMARPLVGAVFSEERRRLRGGTGRLLFANSDLTGFSLFEEAQYHGVKAADRAMMRLG